jgi:chromosome partitioning protein
MKVLSVAYQKGGVGKTTLVAHLAFFAALKEKSVLILDLDEGDLSSLFPGSADGDVVSSDFFQDTVPGVLRPVDDGLYLVNADPYLLDVNDQGDMAITRLKENLRKHPQIQKFDYVIIDAPPNLQRVMLAAMAAADGVVSPFVMSSFSLARIPKFLETVRQVQEHYNPTLQFFGFYPMKVNARSSLVLAALRAFRESNPGMCFPEMITERECVPMSMAAGEPVWAKQRNESQKVAGLEFKTACRKIFMKLDKENV